MLLMLMMVLVEKCCGIKPSMVVKKCKKKCKGKRVVDHSQVEGDHEVSSKYAVQKSSNRVMPCEEGEEGQRDKEEPRHSDESAQPVGRTSLVGAGALSSSALPMQGGEEVGQGSEKPEEAPRAEGALVQLENLAQPAVGDATAAEIDALIAEVGSTQAVV